MCGTYLFQNITFIVCVYLGYSHFILDKFEDFSAIASFWDILSTKVLMS